MDAFPQEGFAYGCSAIRPSPGVYLESILEDAHTKTKKGAVNLTSPVFLKNALPIFLFSFCFLPTGHFKALKEARQEREMQPWMQLLALLLLLLAV